MPNPEGQQAGDGAYDKVLDATFDLQEARAQAPNDDTVQAQALIQFMRSLNAVYDEGRHSSEAVFLEMPKVAKQEYEEMKQDLEAGTDALSKQDDEEGE